MGDKFFSNLSKILIGSEDHELINDIKPMIEKYNYRTLVFSAITFMVALAALLVASAIVDPMRWMFWGYAFFLVILLIFFLITRIQKIKNNRTCILVLLYLEICLSLAFGIIVGNLGQHDTLAVSYHVLLISLPLFICDCPWRLNTIYIIFLVPYLLTSYYFKDHRTFNYDLMNVIIYTILGIFVNTVIQINHFESFSNRCLIKRQRDTDTLTGTLTKKAFEFRVQEVMRKDDCIGVFMIFDIDNFKNINDTLGHAIGDYFISNTGHLILNHCRQTDIVGRFGGDEFVIFLPGTDSIEFINKKANEFMSSLKEYFTKNMSYDNFSISIGCTIYNNPSKTYKEIFNEMDTALYEAKNGGKDKCCIYNQK